MAPRCWRCVVLGPNDEQLVRAMAQAELADVPPMGYSPRGALLRLVELGVIDEPEGHVPIDEVVREAFAACKAWVEAHDG
jgi:hypothetical protein